MKVYIKIYRKIINVLQKVKDKKDEKLWIKKIIKNFKIMHKNQQKNYKVWWCWNWKIQISPI